MTNSQFRQLKLILWLMLLVITMGIRLIVGHDLEVGVAVIFTSAVAITGVIIVIN